MPGWKKNIPVCLQAEPERGERGAPGAAATAREGRSAAGCRAAGCSPSCPPSPGHGGNRPAGVRAGRPAPSILLSRRAGAGGVWGGGGRKPVPRGRYPEAGTRGPVQVVHEDGPAASAPAASNFTPRCHRPRSPGPGS